MYLLQQLFNGLCQGSIYALMAIGYALIYSIVRMVSFNYGETVMIGAFAGYYSYVYTGNFVLGLLFGFAASMILGYAVYQLCYERFLDAPSHITMICTIGFSMLAKNLAQILFGAEVKAMPNVFPQKSFQFLGFRITSLQLVIMAVVVVLCIVLSLFINRTRTGVMLRAVSQDRKASALVGINVNRTTLLGTCIGSGFGGVAGVLLGLYYSTISPTMGAQPGLKSLIANILGGISTITGAAAGGITIGVMENLSVIVVPTGLKDVAAFVFLILILIFRPQGLFAKRRAR